MQLLLRLTFFPIFLRFAMACSSDNCLRALIRAEASAHSFCATYTAVTSTATTGLPSYAIACAGLPTRISSACSCLTTRSSSVGGRSVTGIATTATTPSGTTVSSASTVTASSGTPTCSPGVLQDSQFISQLAGGTAWQVSVNQVSGQVAPLWNFDSAKPNYFNASFPNNQPDPFLSTVTLSQNGVTVCNGYNTLDFNYQSTFLKNATTTASATSNCTITSGLAGVTQNALQVPFETVTYTQPWLYANYIFITTGLPPEGLTTTFFLTVSCTLADWFPAILLTDPNVGRF